MFGLDPDERYVAQMTVIGKEDRSELLATAQKPVPYLLGVLRHGPVDPIDRLLRTDLLTYLPEDLLVKMDRATMANSLEARSPLLDQQLVEFAAVLPTERKIEGTTTKVLLRAIAKQLMPTEHVDRPKMGFAAPIGDWFRGALGVRFGEVVLAPDSALRDHMDQSVAGALLAAHRSNQAENDATLWSLLMFELWARRWLSAGSAAA